MPMLLSIRPIAAVCAAVTLFVAAPALGERFTIVHVNDFDQFDDQDDRGGFAKLQTVLRQLREGRGEVIVTHGGDMISPSLLSGIDKGAHIIALNNAVGIDVATLGNHEFDFGPDVLKERMAEAEYPWVSANVLENGEPFPNTQSGVTREVGDYTIGFFGLTTPDTTEIASPGEAVTFEDPVAAAERTVAELEEAGADVIVALTHLKFATDQELAEIEGIDLVLGGHDHEPMTVLLTDTLIHKSGAQAQYVGVIDVEVETVEGRSGPEVQVTPEWRMISTAGVEPDPEIEARVKEYAGRLDAELGQPVGTSKVELDTRRLSVRTKESNFGNLVADAMRAATGADVAITNGGGIRGDKLYAAGSELTRRDVLSELPFGNKTVLLEVEGATIKQALENGFSQIEDRAGRFPQVSGMTATFDPSAPAGQRVQEVIVGDQPLEESQTYTLATNDYMAGGGDGYAMFEGAKTLIDAYAGKLMATQVIEYISDQGSVAPAVEGRIKEVGA